MTFTPVQNTSKQYTFNPPSGAVVDDRTPSWLLHSHHPSTLSGERHRWGLIIAVHCIQIGILCSPTGHNPFLLLPEHRSLLVAITRRNNSNGCRQSGLKIAPCPCFVTSTTGAVTVARTVSAGRSRWFVLDRTRRASIWLIKPLQHSLVVGGGSQYKRVSLSEGRDPCVREPVAKTEAKKQIWDFNRLSFIKRRQSNACAEFHRRGSLELRTQRDKKRQIFIIHLSSENGFYVSMKTFRLRAKVHRRGERSGKTKRVVVFFSLPVQVFFSCAWILPRTWWSEIIGTYCLGPGRDLWFGILAGRL